MEELIEKFGWKKVVTSIVVFCFLLLGFVVLSFMNMDRKQTAEINKNIEKIKQQEIENNSSTVGFVDTPFKPFATSDYQLSYPKNLSVKTVAPIGGATSNVIFTDTNLNTNIQIEVFPKPQYSYEDAIKSYVLHFEVEKLPLQFDDNAEFFMDDPNTPMQHKTLIFINKQDKYFKISFEYSGSVLDADTERNFGKMLTSMK